MAVLSSHTLNSVDGTHAGGIRIEVIRIDPAGARTRLLDTATDEGGRFQETIADPDPASRYEMVLHTGLYFAGRGILAAGLHILDEVVIRFAMPDPDARYHIPLMLAPNSYSVWWSN
jgi:5-hydroxyisourate hydrolase